MLSKVSPPLACSTLSKIKPIFGALWPILYNCEVKSTSTKPEHSATVIQERKPINSCVPALGNHICVYIPVSQKVGQASFQTAHTLVFTVECDISYAKVYSCFLWSGSKGELSNVFSSTE